MYYYHINMQYTYDSSGGRNRLVWTRDDNLKVTVYAYGAEGLLLSKSAEEYSVYHYDYRGSVVAVTDKEGNITDTVKYTVYGSVSERTGESSLIFGYNGRDGVLTDPNGLLYMRTRYYDPETKRFISSDVIDGTISDSTTLNLYAYVNGNPISFVDPFGLSAQRGETVSDDLGYSPGRSSGILSLFRKYIANPYMLGGYKLFEPHSYYWFLVNNSAYGYTNSKTLAYQQYMYNLEYDIVGKSEADIRNDQGKIDSPIRNLKYGDYMFNYNGCEVIAVYNALLLKGNLNVSMAELIYQHLLVGADVNDGKFGTSPVKTSEILDMYGVHSEPISGVDEMRDEGIYIMTYWDGGKIDSPLHTVAVCNNGKEYILYNDYYSYRDEITHEGVYSERSIDFASLENFEFVYGYSLGRKVHYILGGFR